jgi:RNA polymerase-binding transcription factor DksA
MSGTAYRVCPRCGQPISYIEKHKRGNRVYYYAVHYEGYERTPDGRIHKKVRRCYLGPDKYVLTNKVLAAAGIQVKSLAHQLMEDKPLIASQLEDLVKAVEEKMAKTEMSAYTAQQLADRLTELADRLRKYAEERAKEEARAKGGNLEAP